MESPEDATFIRSWKIKCDVYIYGIFFMSCLVQYVFSWLLVVHVFYFTLFPRQVWRFVQVQFCDFFILC